MGERGRGAPGAQRLPHAAARRQGASRWRAARRTLKDAVNEALRDWVTNVRTTYYLLGSALGPHPVSDDGARLPPRDRRGGARARSRRAHRAAARPAGRLRRRRLQRHRALLALHRATGACASSAWSRAAHGSPAASTAPRIDARARVGVLHGSMSYLLQNDDGQVAEAHSISAGLDYPGRRPRARVLQGRRAASSTSRSPTRRRSRRFQALTRLEGIMPALESAHAVAHAMRAGRDA